MYVCPADRMLLFRCRLGGPAPKGLFNDFPDLVIDLLGSGFRIILIGLEIPSQKDLVGRMTGSVNDRAELGTHSIAGDHASGQIRRALDIVGSTC